MTYLVLRFLHLMFMGTWMGITLFLPGDVRRTLAAPERNIALLDERVRRTGRAAGVMGLLTLLTGVALIIDRGGMGEVPVPIHIGLTLTLVMIVLGAFIGRTWASAATAIQQGDAAAGDAARGRIAMLSGVFQLLWVVVLALMVFRHNLM